MAELPGNLGFAPPRADKALLRRRAVALELIATAGLAVSLVIAATAVSIGNRSLTRGEITQRPAAQTPIGHRLIIRRGGSV